MRHSHSFVGIFRFCTNSVQVNNMALLHLIYNSHTFLHHICATNHFLLHTSSTLLARPDGPDPSCREQVYLGEFQSNLKLFLIMFQGTSRELLAKSLQTKKISHYCPFQISNFTLTKTFLLQFSMKCKFKHFTGIILRNTFNFSKYMPNILVLFRR